MKKNIFLIIGLLMVIAGVAIAYFAKFELADMTGFALTMFGAGIATSQLWQKRDKTQKTWLTVLAVSLVGVGAYLLGFGGFSKETMTTVITMVFGLVGIIAGLILLPFSQRTQSRLNSFILCKSVPFLGADFFCVVTSIKKYFFSV